MIQLSHMRWRLMAGMAALAIAIIPAVPAQAKTADKLLADEVKPVFKPGHTLPALSRWGWSMSYETRVELADHWGYALEIGGYVTHSLVDRLESDPQDINARLVKLAQDNPGKYKVFVLTHRPLGGKRETYPEEYRDAIDVRTADGGVPEGSKAWQLWSPEAPVGLSQWAAREMVAPLVRLQKHVNLDIILNGGEYGMKVYGHSGKYWEQDPRVMAAKGDMSWFDYLSMRKRDQEMPITLAAREAFPNRQLYLWYHFGGVPTWDGWAWSTNAKYTLDLSDLPDQSLYYKHFNTGWTGKGDLLTNFMIATSQAIQMDKPCSYNWYSAGWGDRSISQEDHYYGFLKSTYTAGAIGGVAGYFASPKGGFTADLGDGSPDWLWQMEALGRVHALFSHLEPIVRSSDLLKGDRVSPRHKENPPYEFGVKDDPDVRVLVRKHREQSLWLASAWAADGPARTVTIDVPDLGEVELEARPSGSVYLIVSAVPISFEPPVVSVIPIDVDGMLPSQQAAAQVQKAYKALNQRMSH